MAKRSPVVVLRRFLHVSDLHIDQDSPFERRFPNRLIQQFVRKVPGLYGHDPDALKFLVQLRDELQSQGDCPLEVLFTGDLTRLGSIEDFAAGDAFFDRTSGRRWSLCLSGWRHRAVAGNHDYWPGQLPHLIGFPTQGLKRCFPFVFWVGRAERVSNDLSLRFLGLDSDADLQANGGLGRLLARGHFTEALKDLDTFLRSCPQNEIRVLLLHHSPRRERKFTLGISETSRKALGTFLARHNIRAILTGHVHRFYVGESVFPNCSELRCGTTAQMVRPTADWRGRFPGLPQPDPRVWEYQTALVHEILQSNSELTWRAQVYIRRDEGPFRPLRTLPSREGAPSDPRDPRYEFLLA